MPARRLLTIIALAVCLLPSAAYAQSDEEKARTELKELQRDIKQINREIKSASSRRDKLQNQLRKAELLLASVQKELTENQASISGQQNELKTLEQEQAQLIKARDKQQGRIAVELKTAWQMGQQGQIKVMLNQESPHTVARTMAYYRYFFQARSDLLTDYRTTLASLTDIEQQIAETLEELSQRQDSLEQQQQQVNNAQKSRELAVASLASSIADKGQQLKKLEGDQKQLEKLLAAIKKAISDLEVPENYQAFGKAKGKMPWPVTGKPSNRFGRPRNEGKMRWQGVRIPAREGTSVNAIHHGRVVYADWLRGLGLLLIVDHGDGYMSLYAHNQTLLRDVGEWVNAGTPISTVGATGGQERAALYFEVRKDGKPSDPARWCRG